MVQSRRSRPTSAARGAGVDGHLAEPHWGSWSQGGGPGTRTHPKVRGTVVGRLLLCPYRHEWCRTESVTNLSPLRARSCPSCTALLCHQLTPHLPPHGVPVRSRQDDGCNPHCDGTLGGNLMRSGGAFTTDEQQIGQPLESGPGDVSKASVIDLAGPGRGSRHERPQPSVDPRRSGRASAFRADRHRDRE